MASPQTPAPLDGVYYSKKNDAFIRLRVTPAGKEVRVPSSPGRVLFPTQKGASPEPGDYQRVEPDFGKDASNIAYLGRPNGTSTPRARRPERKHERPLYQTIDTPGPGFYEEPDS